MTRQEPEDALIDTNPAAWHRLLELRGGCRCCLSPPCNACVDPITQEEAERIGLLDDPEPPTEPDYLKAVRDLCR